MNTNGREMDITPFLLYKDFDKLLEDVQREQGSKAHFRVSQGTLFFMQKMPEPTSLNWLVQVPGLRSRGKM